MTRDDIIRVMCNVLGPESEGWSVNEAMLEEWLPFLQAVAAAEREAILQMSAENWYKTQKDYDDAIRARGETK